MTILYIITGIIIGFSLSFLFKNKINRNIKNQGQEITETCNAEELSKYKKINLENNNTIDELNNQIKNLRNNINQVKDSNEDSSDIIEKYKTKNHSLALEIEKMKLELKEYEMLYNARKQEIEFLKQQLNK